MQESIRKAMRLVASSKHGVISPLDMEPIDCFVLFYPSCWNVPRSDAERLARYFRILNFEAVYSNMP